MKEQDIREIWKSGDMKIDTGYQKEQIEQIINRGPKNVISRFISTLRIEQRLNFVIFLGAMIIMFLEQMWFTGWAMIVLNVLFYVYYKNLIEKLNGKIVENNVLIYLQEVYNLMKRFILHYNLASFVLILPAYILSIYFVRYYKEGQGFDFLETMSNEKLITHAFVLAGALLAALLLIHLMYGRKAAKIKTLIDSLTEEES